MTAERYARSAIALHWSIAALLAFQLGLGWRMGGLGSPSAMYAPFQLHKSIGIVILLLSIARVVVRLRVRRPPAAAHGAAGALASAVHAGLYLFMIGAPLTGWVIVSTARIAVPTRLFGILPWPHLPVGLGWHDGAETLHGALGWIGAALIALHVAGALRHHLDRQAPVNVLGRMIPGAGPARAGLGTGMAAALALALAGALPWLAYRPAVPAPVAQATILPEADAPALAPSASADAASAVAASDEAATTADEAAPPRWRVLPGGTLGFAVQVNGEAVNGRFAGWRADVVLDPDRPASGKIRVSVPVLSVETGDETRDTMLKGADFFGGGPATATFSATAIRRLAPGRYRADGTLAMNGAQRPVTLAFTLDVADDVATVAGTTRLDRTAFGIGRGEWAGTDQIAANVEVAFRFTARRER